MTDHANEVTLGPDEIAVAKMIGSRRYLTARAAGSSDVHYAHDDTSEEQDQQAAGAEIAVCKLLGAWWSAISSVGTDNSGADYNLRGRPGQIRHTIHAGGFLLIYPNDNDELPFVLATGKMPNYRVVGWIRGKEAKQDHLWTHTNPRTGKQLFCPAFLVEQQLLKPLPEFVDTTND